jgi:hypothetical protein
MHVSYHTEFDLSLAVGSSRQARVGVGPVSPLIVDWVRKQTVTISGLPFRLSVLCVFILLLRGNQGAGSRTCHRHRLVLIAPCDPRTRSGALVELTVWPSDRPVYKTIRKENLWRRAYLAVCILPNKCVVISALLVPQPIDLDFVVMKNC